MKKGYSVFIIIFFLSIVGLQGQEAPLYEGSIQFERVVLFKNGLGYFLSSATLPEKALRISFRQLPVPIMGTFWVGFPNSLKIKRLYSGIDETTEMAPVSNVLQLIASNIGKKVMIDQSIEGTIVEVTKATPSAPLSPYYMPHISSYMSYPPHSTQLIILKTEGGILGVNADGINRAKIEGSEVQTLHPISVKRPYFGIDLEKEGSKEKINISYLARGITWSPSYLIDLSDSQTAKFSAKALVINEVANLNNVHLDLVTGFPGIYFSNISSPISMTQSLADYLNSLQNPNQSPNRREIMTQQRIMVNDYRNEGPGQPLPSYSTAVEGTTAEDLFFYPIKDFSLKRGETAYLPLFTAEVPYKHVYVWNIPDFLTPEDRYQNPPRRENIEFAEEIWHSCRLTNSMKMPWTTAPAQFIKDGQFTGQDICYYTHPGSKTTIRLNRAMNILAEQAEFELDRKRNATHFYGNSYDLVKIKGNLKLQSKLPIVANIEITKELSGEIREMEPQAKDIPNAKGLRRANPRHSLRWNLEIKPGEEQTITYIYEVYFRD